ncbi:hypothetical protein RYX36_033562 [Vicia faba]
MADTVAEIPIPTKKSRGSRKALKEKTPSASDANIIAAEPKGKAASKKQQQPKQQSFEQELLEMQEKLKQLRLEKEKTDELLKQKDEELENRGKEQEKLQIELKKLQKLKEFKPIMNFPMVKDKEQEKKDKKKKNGCSETKRPTHAYTLWVKDQWHEVKKANPEAEFKDISNILGAKWKTVTAEEKKPYEEKYLAEKEAYLKVITKEKREIEAMKLLEEEQKQKTAMELLEQYMQFKQDTEKENKNKKKKEKDPLKPKQPLSAYFLFTNDRRAAILADNKGVLEVSKITGEEWKNMTEEQKRPYEEVAKKNKEKYALEMEAYKQKKEEEAANMMKDEEEHMKLQKHEALQKLKKKEKTENMIKETKLNRQKKKQSKDFDPNRPKRPASSYIFFSKEARKSILEERPEIGEGMLRTLISLKWKDMSEKDKELWSGKASEAMEEYKKEMEEYNKSIVAKLLEKTTDE